MLRHACGYKLANDGIDTRALPALAGASQYPKYDAVDDTLGRELRKAHPA
jgi:hypothetical protein